MAARKFREHPPHGALLATANAICVPRNVEIRLGKSVDSLDGANTTGKDNHPTAIKVVVLHKMNM